MQAPDQLLAFVASGGIHSAQVVSILIELSIDYILIRDGYIARRLLKVHGTNIAEGSIKDAFLVLKSSTLLFSSRDICLLLSYSLLDLYGAGVIHFLNAFDLIVS